MSTIWVDQKARNLALEKFLQQSTLKPGHFWPGEALERTRDCFNITLAQKDILAFFKFLQKIVFQHKKVIFMHLLNKSRGFGSWFSQIITTRAIQKCAVPFFFKLRNFFLQKFEKWQDFIFSQWYVETTSCLDF